MTFTTFLRKKLVDLLERRRILVWYDAEGDFVDFAAELQVANCEVILATESLLKARRRADEMYLDTNESAGLSDTRNLLIYVPRCRGATEDERMQDPFEVYALAGAAFGDTEDQKIESLARVAMPEKAEEIRRLFEDGRPTVALLDQLEETQCYPVLRQVFRTESSSEVIALALGDMSKAETVDQTPGCMEELRRLLKDSVGFDTQFEGEWRTLRGKAAEYVLFSEFVFDLPDGLPDALSAVSRAATGREVIEAACERMRSDAGLRETYVELSIGVEAALRLPEIMPNDFDPGQRDTFPFEERRLLKRAVELALAGEQAAVRGIIEGRKRSVWRLEPQRSPVWTAVDRATALIDTVQRVSAESAKHKDLPALVKAYVKEGWAELDRNQRRFETAWAACTDDETVAPLAELCRNLHRECALTIQDRFLHAVRTDGWPPHAIPVQTKIFDDYVGPVLAQRGRVAFFLADSLRYEMGMDLAEVLRDVGEVEIDCAAAVLPTITECGMAALMPGANGMLQLTETGGAMVPVLGTRLLKGSSDRMRLLSETYGDRFLETTLDELSGSFRRVANRLQNVDLLVVRTQDPDVIGEHLGPWRARRYLSDVVGDIAAAVKSVVSLGFSRVLISSDHGHVMLPEIAPGDVVQAPPGEWKMEKRRFRLGSSLSEGPGTLTLRATHVGVQGDFQDLCVPGGFKVFTAGEGYFHGGLSLQEAVVPVVFLKSGRSAGVGSGKLQIEIRYRSDRFTSRVIGLRLYLQQTDLFGIPVPVRIEAYDGTSAKAVLVGQAADCEARDEKTREVTLMAGAETPVPVLIDPDFSGPAVEIRASDPGTRIVWARLRLKNAMLD